jgi:hypothetical protein
MSYCRMYDKRHEVYLYEDVNGLICCCGCKLLRRMRAGGRWGTYSICGKERGFYHPGHDGNAWFGTRMSAILHLQHHKLAGHRFPARAEKTLRRQAKDEGDEMPGFLRLAR